MDELVKDGVKNVNELKGHLNSFVKNEVFNSEAFDDDIWINHSLRHNHVVQAIVLYFRFYCLYFPVVHPVSDHT